MKLHEKISISTKSAKRIGRGVGSGKGMHTVGRGIKGQRSRVGRGIPAWFEGGQLPLTKKIPYLRGKSRFVSLKKELQLVTLTQINALKAVEITPEVLVENKIIRSIRKPVKITGVGEIKRAVTVANIACTSPAKAAIEAAGGAVR